MRNRACAISTAPAATSRWLRWIADAAAHPIEPMACTLDSLTGFLSRRGGVFITPQHGEPRAMRGLFVNGAMSTVYVANGPAGRHAAVAACIRSFILPAVAR